MKRTCLYDKHVALGALMQPFGGFDMPIQYTSILEEHNAVRLHCGVFDVSHMGEVMITGKDAQKYVNHIFTNDVSTIKPGEILYGMMLYPDGGTVDDLLVYKVSDEEFFIVVNAANDEKDIEWMRKNADAMNVAIDHCSDYYGQLAVQGPDAESVVEEVLDMRCKELVFYTFKEMEYQGERIIVSRTGYTGEDGFEIYASEALISKLWDMLMESKRCKPCGLGCRDTLRFEVGLPLYGDELSAEISPVMAGLSMFCKLNKDEFIGKDAVDRQKTEGVAKKLVGIELHDRAIPRHGYEVMVNDEVIGTVTTGYHTISTDKSVCMALIDSKYSFIGTALSIKIRKKIFSGTVCKKRFYEKHYKK